MCGRYSLAADGPSILKRFGIPDPPSFPYAPRYNIAPGQEVPVVVRREEHRLLPMHWGMEFPWSRDGGRPLINVRSESADQKPAFRQALLTRRCLLPSDGFYEWQKAGRESHPFRFVLPEEALFGLAGIWQAETGAQGQRILSCAILTREAEGAEGSIHARMPVILPREAEEAWLDPALRDGEGIRALLQLPSPPLRFYRVSPWVNAPRHEGPECAVPLE